MTGVIKTYDNIQPREISPTSLGSCPNAPRTQVGEVDWMHWDVSEGTHQASPLTHEKEFCWLFQFHDLVSSPHYSTYLQLGHHDWCSPPSCCQTWQPWHTRCWPQNIKLHNDNGWWEKHPSIINFIQFDPWYVFTSGGSSSRDTSEHQTTNI